MHLSLIVIGMLWAGFVNAINYAGDFRKLETTTGCESIFENRYQDVTFTQGDDSRAITKATMHFSNPDPKNPSILGGADFNGHFVVQSHLLLARSYFNVGKTAYRAKFDGHADSKSIAGKITVTKMDSENRRPLCTASAEFSSSAK